MHVDATAPPPPLPDSKPQAIAPWAHTLGLFALLGFTTWLGHGRARQLAANHDAPVPHYGISVALEWILLGLVLAGIRQRRFFLRGALGHREHSLLSMLGYGAMTYVLGFMATLFVGAILYATPVGKQRNVDAVLALLPHTPLQFLMWFAVSLTAGICEELIFRGYLQQQLTAWTERPLLAIVLGSLLFGGVHLYEGLGAILPLAALGVVYGLVVRRLKGDLRAVMVAHTLQDFLVAVFALAKPLLDHYQPKH